MQAIQIASSISVAISVPFITFSLDDVAQWEEVKKLLNFREALDKSIIKHNFGIALKEDGINPEPPVEIAMNGRWFLSITEFTYEASIC